MARVRLNLRPMVPGIPYVRLGDPPGAVAYIPRYRLDIQLVVVPHDGAVPALTDVDEPCALRAVVDTGAPLSIFPFHIWQPFAEHIRWRDQPAPPEGRRHEVAVLGGVWAYRLGQVRVGATDDDENWLPPVWVNAWFLADPTEAADPRCPRVALVGLRCRLLDRRQLRSAGDSDDDHVPDWWLEDA